MSACSNSSAVATINADGELLGARIRRHVTSRRRERQKEKQRAGGDENDSVRQSNGSWGSPTNTSSIDSFRADGPIGKPQVHRGYFAQCLEVAAVPGDQRDLPSDSDASNEDVTELLSLRARARGPNGCRDVGRILVKR
jgi:hypothetical protein